MPDQENPGNANLPIGDLRNPIPQNSVIGWHSRGYLPHFENPGLIQHVTFHLFDSLPQSTLIKLEFGFRALPIERRDLERRKRLDAWIDAGHGSCVLRQPDIAAMVQESLLRFDSDRYRLLAWTVMPNHVHVLFEPIDGWTVAKIVTAWKKFTARRISDSTRENDVGLKVDPQCHDGQRRKDLLPSSIWHREYWDRYIRDEAHLKQVIDYIHSNPVKAGLVGRPENWRWSSAFSQNAHKL